MHRSYLGIGSNLKNPSKQVEIAIQLISSHQNIHLIAKSSLYQSRALIHPERPTEVQPDYLNAVIAIKTTLSAQELLEACQSIETSMGRVRSGKVWEARVIDIDILLFDQLIYSSDTLTLPHPEMKQRAFVLEPLFEIEPELIFPDGISLKSLQKK